MAMSFEKPLKDFLKNFQKDLNVLQKTLKKESDELVKKVKTTANKDSVVAKRKELEQLIEKNLKKYEPTINKFVHELNTSAKKAGVDLTQLEKKVKDNLKTARTRLTKAGDAVKKKAPGKKAGGKKATASAKKTKKPAEAAAPVAETVGADEA